MGKILPVTSNQGDAIRAMGNEKRVGRARWQRAHDDGRFAAFLDSLTEPVPPPGCRMHILKVRVKLDEPWENAVNAAGPNTPKDYNVRKVGDLYLPAGTGEQDQEYILLNYLNRDGSWEKALVWGAQEELLQTVPREAFAVGKQYPYLRSELQINPMYVVATTPCTFEGDQQACSVWWDGSKRGTNLRWTSALGHARDWFLFRKSSASASKP